MQVALAVQTLPQSITRSQLVASLCLLHSLHTGAHTRARAEYAQLWPISSKCAIQAHAAML